MNRIKDLFKLLLCRCRSNRRVGILQDLVDLTCIELLMKMGNRLVWLVLDFTRDVSATSKQCRTYYGAHDTGMSRKVSRNEMCRAEHNEGCPRTRIRMSSLRTSTADFGPGFSRQSRAEIAFAG